MTLLIINLIVQIACYYLWYKIGQTKARVEILKELVNLSQDYTTQKELDLSNKILEKLK